jgi:Tfp pilus assembly protein FimT
MKSKDLGNRRYAASPRGASLLEVLFVVSAALVLSAISVTKVLTITKNLSSQSDARTISGDTSLAKMSAASNFTRVRIYANLSGNAYEVDVWNKITSQWTTQQSSVRTLPHVTMGYGSLSSPPTGTQTTLGQAAACLNNSGTAIANTACIVFNSRGVPVDSTGSPTSAGAIYVTDGVSVYGITVSAMGLIQTWKSPASSSTWVRL